MRRLAIPSAIPGSAAFTLLLTPVLYGKIDWIGPAICRDVVPPGTGQYEVARDHDD